MVQKSFPLPNWVQSYLELPRSKDSKVSEIQDKAASYLLEHGFPNKKNEAWHYTDLSKLPDSFSNKANFEEAFRDYDSLLFVDGRLVKNTLPAALVTVHQNANAVLPFLETQLNKGYNPFSLLSLLVEAVDIEIKRSLENPIKLRFVTSGGNWICPVYIKVASGVTAKIQEHYLSLKDDVLVAPTIAVDLEKEATLTLQKFQLDNAKYQVNSLFVRAGEASSFKHLNLTVSAGFIRNNVDALISGKGAAVSFKGLSLGDGNAHIDNHLEIEHLVPETESNTVYRGVYNETANGNFDGAIVVQPEAQKTVALQSTKSILLSEKASSNAKPELKIWADDVKCSHGAAVGQLDEEALFYLQSRGMPYEKAKALLVEAFAAEVLNDVSDEKVKEVVLRVIRGQGWKQ